MEATNGYSVGSVLFYLVCVLNDSYFLSMVDYFPVCIGCVWSDIFVLLGRALVW